MSLYKRWPQCNRVGLHTLSGSLDSSQITSSNTVRTHPPEEWRNKRRRKAEGEGPTFFSLTLALLSLTRHGGLKASQRGKCVSVRVWERNERISLGGNVQQLRPGFPLRFSSPSVYSSTLSHGYILRVSTKPLLHGSSYTYRLQRRTWISEMCWMFPRLESVCMYTMNINEYFVTLQVCRLHCSVVFAWITICFSRSERF